MATAPIHVQKTNDLLFAIQLYHKYSDVTDLKVTIDTADGDVTLMKASKVAATGWRTDYITGSDEENFLVHFKVAHSEVSVMPEDTLFIRIEYTATDVNMPGETFYMNERAPFTELIA